jgi:eukaryotic-like serine/threonine-protein kinase
VAADLDRASRTEALPAADAAAPPSAGDGAPPPLWREVDDPSPGSRPRSSAWVAIALLAVLAVLVGLGWAAARDDPADTPAADPTTAQSTEQTPSSSAPETSASEETQPAGVPAGFTLYEDPTGFSVAVPDGWEPVRDGPRVDFREPGGSRFLRVDQTDDPKRDAEKDWERQEKAVSKRLPDYERIDIDSVDYRDYEAADWEFTFGDGPTHVLNRGMNTGDRGYALYFSAPDSQWDESESIRETIFDTFRPAD